MKCSLRLLTAGLVMTLGLAACTPVDSGDTQDPAPSARSTALDAPLPEASLYALEATWTSQDGAALQLTALRGQPVVLAMVYAHCAYACPLLVHDMKQIGAALLEEAGVRYVLVSLDPARDTEAQLRQFKESFGLDERWTLLRGDARDVRQLAALLGVRYRREADGQISHSNLITLLDHDGQISTQQEGLGTEPTETVQAIRGLLAQR